MKNSFYLLMFLFSAFMASCGSSNSNEDDATAVEFRSYDYDVIASVAGPDSVSVEGGGLCRVSGHGVLPVRVGNLDISELKDSLTKLAEIIVVDKKITRPSLSNDLSLTQKDPSTTEACSIMINNLSVDLVTPLLIVWKDYAYLYPCAAAHGTYSTTYVNFSIAMGKMLSLDDMFAPGYEKELEKIIREKLLEDNVTLLVDINEVTIPSDFRLTTNSIEFVYSLYEIAPYSEGEIRVEIPCYEIEELFNEGVEQKLFGSSFN